jgi:hypothetical protein
VWSPLAEASDQGDNEKHEKYEEEYFGNPGRCSGYTAKAEDRGNDRYDEKDHSPSQHFAPP